MDCFTVAAGWGDRVPYFLGDFVKFLTMFSRKSLCFYDENRVLIVNVAPLIIVALRFVVNVKAKIMNGVPLIIVALRFMVNVQAKLMNGVPLIIVALRFMVNVQARLMNGATFSRKA
jgi:hypothetical protein